MKFDIWLAGYKSGFFSTFAVLFTFEPQTMFNKILAGILPCLPKKLVWIFSRKYIAGETIEDAIRVSKELNASGIRVTIDLLGEFITDLSQATANRDAYLEIIDRIQKEGIQGNYSLKPTMFGLLLDSETCYANIRQIVAKAAGYGNFIRVDMEDSQCTDLEIDLFRKLKAEFPRNVGLVVQAYLRRTMNDLRDLADLHTSGNPLNFRLCKGIYVEPEAIAFKQYEEVNENYLQDLEFMLRSGMFAGIATHDKPLVEGAYRIIEQYNVPKTRYEFQMLYGVTPELRNSIVARGHAMRVYVPFGKEWFGYSTRRLKENPKIASHIVKALFIRK